MVYKVSKGGVRSGNTLRCTHSVKVKRYSRQQCIITRSNLYPEEIPKLLDSSEDTLVNSILGSPDVMLSLNKKARWRVPAEISHMITAGNFNKGKTLVSFLERHKLKRTANCIRFVSNHERLGQVVPRQKRYFSFNQQNIDRDQSHRQLKQQRGTTKENPPKVRLMTDRRKNIMKTIEVFTVSGYGKPEDVKKRLVSSKPEYRIEAFYPSPKSCSLTYNPKYTDVHVEFGQDGQTEIKSNAKPLKGTRRHRKRFSLKDLRLYEDELNASDEHELWYDENDQNDRKALLKEEDVSILDNKNDRRSLISLSENESKKEDVLDEDQSQLFDNTIAGFIVQAERKLSQGGLVSQVKKHSRRHPKEQAPVSGFMHKPHIVYISETALGETQGISASKYNTLQSAKTILKSAETSPEKLRATFGRWYQEGNSEPRRFTINMAEDVNNLLNPVHNLEHEGTFIAHLVFVHDSCFEEDLDVFKVMFNSNCCEDSFTVSNNIPFKETSINEIMGWVICGLIDMKLKNRLSITHTHYHEGKTASVANFVNKCLREDETYCFRSHQVDSNSHVTEDRAKISPYVNSLNNLGYDIFCDSCYENIDVGSTSWTKLLGCRHLFCDQCWASHLHYKLKKGNIKLACPSSSCDVIIDAVTLLSLLHVSEVSQLLVNELEDGQSSDWKLCPAPSCGRIVRHITEEGVTFDVLCSCGHGFCFLCLSEPHWPCNCKQAEQYFQELRMLKPISSNSNNPDSDTNVTDSAQHGESNEDQVFEIENRICPKCSNLFAKDGGCSYMICKCGYEFCWICAKAWNRHKWWDCVPQGPYVLKYTQKVTVRHLVTPKMFTLEGETKTPRVDARGQKATIYYKALQQRLEAKENLSEKQIQETMRTVSYIAQRRLPGKKEILTMCGVQFDDTVGSKLDRFPLLPPVENYIRSCHERKRAVHHMAEFTFVLLKDVAASEEKRRALRLLRDLLGYCSIMKSVLDLGPDRDVRDVIRQLADIRKWNRRTMTALVSSIQKLTSFTHQDD